MSEKGLNMIFYCLAALVGTALYFGITNAPDSVVQILLLPYARASESFFNIALEYIPGVGYLSADSTFAIGRECLGAKFTLALFGMAACMFVKYFKGPDKVKWLVISLTGAILAGALANAIRIVGSIPFVTDDKFPLIHLAMGASTYLLIMIAGYFGLNMVLGRRYCEKIY